MAAKFTRLESKVVPLLVDNVDTDQIIPARFLKTIDKQGLGNDLFSDWRYDAQGEPKPEFALNRPEHRGAEVLLAGDNFGCGSSREHAPWALLGFGLRAVISTSFADIFSNNSLKNGLLPVVVDAATHARLAKLVASDSAARVEIDLADCKLTLPDGTRASFPVEPFARHCLLNGIDELGYIQSFEKRIEEHEARQR
jgi:3-isopropylmalate/(R)-2-methylmalate dehydratase small subunit